VNGLKKPVVVSVEDDGELFALIAVSLKSLPIDLFHASTGREGIALVQQLAPALVLLDISLPDVHGWEVLRELKEDEGVDLRDVIVLTTYTDPRHRVMGHFQEVTAYISKPFNPRELAALVAKTLNLPYAYKSAT
jgi:DNA-binding response OmpR family regulator